MTEHRQLLLCDTMSHWHSAYCKANGINIHYTRTGGSKLPLLMLHGLMTSGMCCWSDTAQFLEEKYDVIMPDARGHGNSSAPDFGYRYEDHADDIIGFIEALGLRNTILLGHSMGGMTAAVAACQKPNLFSCVILVDPTFLSLETQRKVYESDVAEQHRRILALSLDDAMADAQRRHPNRSEEQNLLTAQARRQTSMTALDVLLPPNPNYRTLMSMIDIPCLMLVGDNGVVAPEIIEELRYVNPSLQIEEIKDAGHSVHRDQPERFLHVIESFLRNLMQF